MRFNIIDNVNALHTWIIMNHKTSIVKLKQWYRSPMKDLTWIDSLTIEQREYLEQRIRISKLFSVGERIGFMSYFEIQLRVVS